MSDHPVANGVTTPLTSPKMTPLTSPKMNGFALTEYTAAPTPPSERNPRFPGVPPDWGIPESCLLPNGYPDVRTTAIVHCFPPISDI